ncbi:MAG: NINE protein [Saprospiraceae bacterium]|nr:NINE protein [Candidatus Vicinibacter proximus]MBL7822356.1 NINE protein [Saprospiraceae bacterium]MCC6843108.1 NINE protein [Saprospiraceae bacterium]HRG32006.1 NINE protein [Saprospiraceae bacterium]
MKNKWVAVLLAIMAGGFGVHRFYLRQPELGLLYIGIYFWMSFFKILNFPLSTLIGWYDAYRLLMMDQNEFDRRYNSHNFRDRYGNRRDQTKEQSSRQGRYILLDEDENTTQKSRRGYFDLYKSKKKSESHKQSGIKKFKNYDLKGAIEEFKLALDLNSSDTSTHFNIACAYSLSEKAKEAFKHLDEATSLGFSDFDKIMTHESLSFIRVMPEFEAFRTNQFRLSPEILESLNKTEQEQVLELSRSKEQVVVENKGGYGSYFEKRINDPFK